jgi:hypothetical protein
LDLGVAEYLPRFLLSIDASLFCFLLASPLLRDDHFFPHLYDNYGGCRSTPCLPTFLWTVLPLGTHSRAPMDYLVEPSHFRNACCFGGRFFLGAHCFVFSLLRSTTVAHFSSARLVWSPPPTLSKIQLHLRSPILFPLTIFHHQTLLTWVQIGYRLNATRWLRKCLKTHSPFLIHTHPPGELTGITRALGSPSTVWNQRSLAKLVFSLSFWVYKNAIKLSFCFFSAEKHMHKLYLFNHRPPRKPKNERTERKTRWSQTIFLASHPNNPGLEKSWSKPLALNTCRFSNSTINKPNVCWTKPFAFLSPRKKTCPTAPCLQEKSIEDVKHTGLRLHSGPLLYFLKGLYWIVKLETKPI